MTTKGASFSYEEVIDLHTESDRVTVIGIHTPTGDTPRRMAPGLFSQFKKYRYLGCSVMMVPAATLPVDPLGVSYEAGEVPQIDPRDMLNPILFHGCHGNDLGNILNRIYSANAVEGSDLSQILGSDSATFWSMFNSEEEGGIIPSPGLSLLESLYYRALTDRTWQKANIQRGFKKRGLHPRVYTLATNMQLMGEALYTGRYNAPAPFYGEDASDPYLGDGFNVTDPASNPVRFFTPRTQRLGWLDTRTVVGYDSKQSLGFVPDIIADAKIENVIKEGTVETTLPRIYMGVILLPPAYKTEQYFRMIITHRFAFAGFRGISMSDLELRNPNYFNLNDRMTSGDSDDPEPDPVPDPDPIPDPVVYSKIRLSNDIGGGAGVYTRMQAYDSGGNVVFDYSAGSGRGIGLNIGGVSAQVMANTPVVFTISGGPSPYFALCQGSSTIFNFKTYTPDATTINTNSSLRTALETTLGGTINVWNFSGITDLKEIWKLPVEVVS